MHLVLANAPFGTFLSKNLRKALHWKGKTYSTPPCYSVHAALLADLWSGQLMHQPQNGSLQYHAHRHLSYLEMLNPSLRASKQGASMLFCSRELKKYPSSNEVFFIHFYLLRVVFTRMLPFTSPAEHLSDAQTADLGINYHVEGGPPRQNLDAHPSGETQ